MKKIAVLGSTGSIGTQTLEIVRTNQDIKVTALAAGNNIELLEQQIREFSPKVVAVWKEERAKELKEKIRDLDVKVLCGMDGLLAVAAEPEAEILVTAIVGMIGILPTIEAIRAGKDIALANKETLVTAGHIIIPLAKKMGVSILPVDSEHSAIFQSLQGGQEKALHKILLTASGGPFRGKKREELQNIRVEDALKHPNWAMGRKITIDSSTMVNKGLEVVIRKELNNDQWKRYEIFQDTLGGRPYLFNGGLPPGGSDGSGTPGIDYQVPVEALTDEEFAAIYKEAQKYVGTPYVWGGSTPETGFDCSGYVCWVYNQNGYDVGRTTANGLWNKSQHISEAEAKPGDLVFFDGTYDTPGKSHVGIYLGNGKMVSAGDPIKYADIHSSYWQKYLSGFGRLSK